MNKPLPRYKSRILANCALPTGVDNDAINEDTALSHVGKISHS